MSLRYLLLLKIINNPEQKVMPAFSCGMGKSCRLHQKKHYSPIPWPRMVPVYRAPLPLAKPIMNECLPFWVKKRIAHFNNLLWKIYLKSAVVSVVSTFARRLMKRNCEMRKRGRRQTLQSQLGWEEGSLWTKNKTFFNSHSILRQNASSHNIFLYFYAQHM